MTNTQENNSFANAFGFELLFEDKPSIDVDTIISELEKHLGRIVKGDDEQTVLLLMEHTVDYTDAKQVPTQLALLPLDKNKESDDLSQEIQQSWQTSNAAELVRRSKHKVWRPVCTTKSDN